MRRNLPALAMLLAGAGMLGGAGIHAQSLPETAEAIAQARVATRILYVTAHPDDESSGILTYLARGLHADVALLSVTRGEGGQNAIGPEQGPELGILRTQELLAATRGYGAHLFFTRAPDFGYSKTAEETLRIWDGIALEDMVRVLRTYRPDIVINQWGGVHTGHGQHQATGLLMPEAVEKAADPAAYPKQISEGLRPWHVRQVLRISRSEAPPAGAWSVPVNSISPLWGRSYAEIGLVAFAHHRSQGVTAFLNSPFFRREIYLAPLSGETFQPQTLAEPLPSLAEMAPGNEKQLREGLQKTDSSLGEAWTETLNLHWADAARNAAEAGKKVEELHDQLCEHPKDSGAEICWRLARERNKIDAALADIAAVEVDGRSSQDELVADETAAVNVRVQYRDGIGLTAQSANLHTPAGWTVKRNAVEKNEGSTSEAFTIKVPAGAAAPVSPANAILPEPEPLLEAQLPATIDGYSFAVTQPVLSLRTTSTSAELAPLILVPQVTLTVEPRQLMAPEEKLAAGDGPLKLLARVRFHGDGSANVTPDLELPAGWKMARPPSLDFSGPGDQLVRFEVTPPAHVAEGAYELRPYAETGGEKFRTSAEALPSLPTRVYMLPAEATVHVLNLKIPPRLRIGYVAADNDLVPDELRQLGISVDLLDSEQLAFGDLSKYSAIAIGIRAYELRPDLARANARLLDYVKSGGTLVVQYQRDFVWNRLNPAPFPASMPRRTSRTTDENSPVDFLAPESPLLNFPNKIGPADFQGWVQERGLYYWGDFDSRYQAVLGFRDPGEEVARGALVWARDGKGVYIYTGIAFFRQLRAGVPGAFRLFVNLLSQSRIAR